MEIATGCSTNPHEKDVAHEAASQLKDKIGIPSFLFVLSTVTYDNHIILQELKRYFPETKIVGGTSCVGIITNRGYCSDNQRGLGLFGIQDESGCYGVAARPINGDPHSAGQEVIREALNNAKRPGESPAMILMTSAPGHEEALINGIMSVVGKQVPIFGGTSADNSISGLWLQFCGDQRWH
jgi:hypothetical protein